MNVAQMDPTQQIEAARAMLSQAGAPINAANLNRAMEALYSGNQASGFDMTQESIRRTTTPPRGRVPTAPLAAAQPAAPMEALPMPDEPNPLPPESRPTASSRGSLAAPGVSNNGARVIDENDPTAGMFGAGPRVATGTPESTENVGDALSTALAVLLGGGLPLAVRGGAGAGTAVGMPNFAIPNIGRPVVGGAARNALPGPGMGAGPALPPAAGAGVPRVGGPSGGGSGGAQARLPAPAPRPAAPTAQAAPTPSPAARAPNRSRAPRREQSGGNSQGVDALRRSMARRRASDPGGAR